MKIEELITSRSHAPRGNEKKSITTKPLENWAYYNI